MTTAHGCQDVSNILSLGQTSWGEGWQRGPWCWRRIACVVLGPAFRNHITQVCGLSAIVAHSEIPAGKKHWLLSCLALF